MDSHKVEDPHHRENYLDHQSLSLFTWWWDQYFVGEPAGKLDVLTECWATWKKCRSSKWLKLSQGVLPTVVCVWERWGTWKKKSFTSNIWACYHSLHQSETHSSRWGFTCQRVSLMLIKAPNVSQRPGSLQYWLRPSLLRPPKRLARLEYVKENLRTSINQQARNAQFGDEV